MPRESNEVDLMAALEESLKPKPPSVYPKAPPRGPLPPEVARAVRTIHGKVWGEPYVAGRGPMHWAGGPYWHNELLRLASQWERMAAAARICAEFLPEADDQ